MIGIALITHQPLGQALASCLTHILGTLPPQLALLELAAGDCPAELMPQANRLIQGVNSGDGVLVLTDLYGASPSNLAAQLIVPLQVEVITGVNLAMLLRAVSYREHTMASLIEKLISGGKASIFRVERTAHADPTSRNC